MLLTTECKETVSIIESIFLNADGACVDLGFTSLLGGVALFVGAVVALRLIGVTVLRSIFPSLRRDNAASETKTKNMGEEGLQRLPYESPIRSTGAWGSKAR